jgi:hypothetical protein
MARLPARWTPKTDAEHLDNVSLAFDMLEHSLPLHLKLHKVQRQANFGDFALNFPNLVGFSGTASSALPIAYPEGSAGPPLSAEPNPPEFGKALSGLLNNKSGKAPAVFVEKKRTGADPR